MSRLSTFCLASAVTLSLAACATSPDAPASKEANSQQFDTAYRMLGMRSAVDEEPGLLQRAIDDSTKSPAEELAETQRRVAQLEQALLAEAASEQASPRQIERPAAQAAGPRAKLGIRYPASGALSTQLQRAITAASRDYPVTVVDSSAIAQELKAAGCDALTSECLKRLSVYPGVQLLAVFGGFQTEATKATGSVELLDPATGVKLQEFVIELPAADGQVPMQTLQALADRILSATLAHAGEIPWSTRAFSKRGDQWYLSAGKNSGIKSGDVLEVHRPGTWLRSPSGSLAAWIPGEVKGLLRVDSLVGADVAAATLIQGQAPTPEDPLTLRPAGQAATQPAR